MCKWQGLRNTCDIIFNTSTDVWGFSTDHWDKTIQPYYAIFKHELIAMFKVMTQMRSLKADSCAVKSDDFHLPIQCIKLQLESSTNLLGVKHRWGPVHHEGLDCVTKPVKHERVYQVNFKVLSHDVIILNKYKELFRTCFWPMSATLLVHHHRFPH